MPKPHDIYRKERKELESKIRPVGHLLESKYPETFPLKPKPELGAIIGLRVTVDLHGQKYL